MASGDGETALGMELGARVRMRFGLVRLGMGGGGEGNVFKGEELKIFVP